MFFCWGVSSSGQAASCCLNWHPRGSGGLWQLWAANLCQATVATLPALGKETQPSYCHSVPGLNIPSPPPHTHLNLPQPNRGVTQLQEGLGIMEGELSVESDFKCRQKQLPEAHLTRAVLSVFGTWPGLHTAESSSHLLPESSGPTVKWLCERKHFSVSPCSVLLAGEAAATLAPQYSFPCLLSSSTPIYWGWQSAQVKDYSSTPQSALEVFGRL